MILCLILLLFNCIVSHDALKLLAIITAHDLGHIDSLQYIVGQYVSICEMGWDVRVVIISSISWSTIFLELFTSQYYCFRISQLLNIQLDYRANLKFKLPRIHRFIVAEEIDNHDVFVYQEDDIMFSYPHLVAYLEETKNIAGDMEDSVLKLYCIGFIRFRRNSYDSYITKRDRFEEYPFFSPFCHDKKQYIMATGNTHQAFWILTKYQLLLLNASCNFLGQSPSTFLPR